MSNSRPKEHKILAKDTANAHLIIAAPDLLEASKRIYDFPCECHCEISDEMISVYDQLRKAIAKAEGGEQ